MGITDTRGQVRHLLSRAGFGQRPAELNEYAALGFEGAVDRLLGFGAIDDPAAAAAEQQGYDLARADGIRQWWLYRMLNTTRPLQEKLTLFWHGHFATSVQKVNNPVWMRNQNELFRRQGTGSFRDLVLAVAKDPAMMRYLDTIQNRKNSPNENFARELMELFTMGIGNYTETDVKEATRAFTGWTIREDVYFFNANQHDNGQKTVLDRTGNLNGEDVVDLVVAHPATGPHLAAKLWAFFAYDNPETAVVERLSQVYYSSGYSIEAMLRELFLAPEFRSTRAYHATIKSPVEFVLGTFKLFGLTTYPQPTPGALRAMGQDLFAPTSVKGWDGGTTWINSTSFLTRCNLGNVLVTSRSNGQPLIDPIAMAERASINVKSADEVVRFFVDLMLDGDLSAGARSELARYVGDLGRADRRTLDTKVRGLVHLIMATPVYQFA
ncbi:MAG: DUF1800 domain-containing protein [Chloroflexi bacterium]|nr:DUF1800 domain-containing protein [Chloroflexota bacterium]